jgi:hypothetical protein
MSEEMKKLAIAGAILFAGYKYAPNAIVKAAVLGVAGIVVAKQTPYVKEVV